MPGSIEHQFQSLDRVTYEFQASGHLVKALRLLLIPAAQRAPLPIFATRQAMARPDDFTTEAATAALARQKGMFLRHEAPIYIGSDDPEAPALAIEGNADSKSVKIKLVPRGQIAFDQLVSGISALPDLYPQPKTGHSLYLELAGRAFLPDADDLAEKFEEAKKHVLEEGRLHSVKPSDIVLIHPPAPKPETAQQANQGDPEIDLQEAS